MTSRRPDFFLVGAPKAGTSSLHAYLRQHPDVYLPETKDVPYFGSDLHYNGPRPTRDEYLSWFEDARDEKRVGESSVQYLISTRAAAEIADFAPDAAILVMLRNPAEVAHSLHRHAVWMGDESLVDFETALAAEPERREGRALPPARRIDEGLFYRETGRYADQLERYFAQFGRDRVHVVVFDDFVRDTAVALRQTFEFLGVDPNVDVDLTMVNAAREPRNRLLQRFLTSPPPRLERAFHTLAPRSLHGRVVPFAKRLNTRAPVRSTLDDSVRRRLQEEYRPDVERLGELLGRDLTHWCRPAG